MKLRTELNEVEKITAVVTDLDETLWKGILAEQQKISLNREYYAFLKLLYSKGVQLFVVSKNDVEDVEKAFETLGIDKNLFTSIIANWDQKYLNIAKLVTYTELRPETVVFIDDNPIERAEVRAKLPKIHCLPAENWDFLQRSKAISSRKEQVQNEIEQRINRYKTAILANEQRVKTDVDDLDFYRSLKRELSIGEVSGDNLDRVTRLFVETHRINFNPGKFAVYEEAIEYLYGRLNKGDKIFAISTKESGIPLGLTGVFLLRIENSKAFLTDASFSCGIIGRDFEQKSILALIEKLKKQGIGELYILVTLTSTNKRVREILQDLGFELKATKDNQSNYAVDLNNFKQAKSFDWIKIANTPPELDYVGHPAVISFFEKDVRPLIKNGFKVTNLGASRGEVLGHLQKKTRDEFYNFLEKKNVQYKKIDKEFYPGEQNIVGDAENLTEILQDESQDLVIAVELLEHAEHFWKIINEAIRICKVNGHIFLSVPSFNYPKHEYPIDLWRIGPQTLASFFSKPAFEIVKLELEGKKELPRRTIILVKKLKNVKTNYAMPKNGKTNWQTGLTIFP